MGLNAFPTLQVSEGGEVQGVIDDGSDPGGLSSVLLFVRVGKKRDSIVKFF